MAQKQLKLDFCTTTAQA